MIGVSGHRRSFLARLRHLWQKLALLIATAAGLAACAAPQLFDGDSSLGLDVGDIHRLSPEEARTYIANRTVMTYDPGSTYCYSVGRYPICNTVPGHGTQIEYFGPDGRAYLWYPGNSRPVPSRWSLIRRQSSDRYSICFRYPSNSRNPLTGTSGSSPQCRDLSTWVSGITEVRDNDLFDLSTGTLPYPLKKSRTTFDKLLEDLPTS